MPESLRERLRLDVLDGARALLGAVLVGPDGSARIVEVEAYRAEDDPGCHGFRGVTDRNRTMFGPPGHAYVYFSYGCHWMLNVSAHAEGRGAAVLIRAAVPLRGQPKMAERRGVVLDRDLLSGPGKLCQAFGISRGIEGIDLFSATSEFQIDEGIATVNVIAGRRIGLAKGKGDELPWRFLDGDARAWWSRPLLPELFEERP